MNFKPARWIEEVQDTSCTGDLGVSPKILLIFPFVKGGLRKIRDTEG